MSDNFLETNFGEDTPVSHEIRAFMQMLVDSKMLRFELTEASSQFPEMAMAGLITKAPYFSPGLEGTYTNDPRIMYAFYHHFSPVFGYMLTADATAIQDFAHKVGGYFHAQAPQGVSGLVGALIRFLLDNARLGYGLDLSAYALTLQRSANHERFFYFFNAYIEVILTADDSFELVWEVCRHFALQIGPPQINDMVWRNLSRFVHAWVDRHKGRLAGIRAIAEQEQTDPALKVLYLELLLKIRQEGALTVEEIVDWLDQETTQATALSLLYTLNVEGRPLRQRLLDKLAGLSVTEEQKLERLQAYLKMLHDSAADDPAFKAQLIKEISAHFHDPGIADLSVSLNILGRCTAEPKARYGIIEDVLHSERFKPEYLNSMDIFFIINNDLPLFFRFLKAASLKLFSAKDVQRAMEGPIHMHRGEAPADFEREAVLLCVDSEGVCRLLGQELLLNEFQLDQTASLTYDIRQLDMLQQYKMVISLLNQMHPINHTHCNNLAG